MKAVFISTADEVKEEAHVDHVDVVVVREGLQHLADRRSDEFEGEARNAATPAVWNNNITCIYMVFIYIRMNKIICIYIYLCSFVLLCHQNMFVCQYCV